jgi:hypothetical protein
MFLFNGKCIVLACFQNNQDGDDRDISRLNYYIYYQEKKVLDEMNKIDLKKF